jgi:hypothetical protein
MSHIPPTSVVDVRRVGRSRGSVTLAVIMSLLSGLFGFFLSSFSRPHAVAGPTQQNAGTTMNPAGGNGGRLRQPELQHSAAVRGTVKDRHGAAVRFATIGIRGATRREVLTNNLGEYAFEDLPTSPFQITASKAGLVTVEENGQFGESLKNDFGTPTGPLIINFVLATGGALTGVVADETGTPIPDASVMLLRRGFAKGHGQWMVAQDVTAARSDDRGQYRLISIPPGEYIVSATTDLPFRDAHTGALLAYPTAYYPAYSAEAKGPTLRVASGSATTANLHLTAQKLVHVSGRVVDHLGAPAQGGIVRVTQAGMTATTPRVISFTTGGMFQVDLFAGSGICDLTASIGGAATGGVSPPEIGRAQIAVNRADLAGIQVATALGGTISGQVMIHGSNQQSMRAPVRVFVRSTETGSVGGGSALVGPDGTFVLPNVFGRSRILVDLDYRFGLAVESVQLNGVDVTDTGFDVLAGKHLDGIAIVLTTSLTRVDGIVRTPSGDPAKAFVAMIPTNEVRALTAPERYTRLATTDGAGRFTVIGLPPANYIAVAGTDINRFMMSDPEGLSLLRRDGVPVTVPTTQSAPITLRLP